MDERNQRWMGGREPRRMVRARCPSCQSALELPDEVDVWDEVQCPSCAAQLALVERYPPLLDFAAEPGGDDWQIIDLDDFEAPDGGYLGG